MSIVTKDFCACGKPFSEENNECVFNYHKKSEPEEFIEVLKDQIEELKSDLQTQKFLNEELQKQHNTDLKIIELYREKLNEKEQTQDRLSEEGK